MRSSHGSKLMLVKYSIITLLTSKIETGYWIGPFFIFSVGNLLQFTYRTVSEFQVLLQLSDAPKRRQTS